MVKEDKVPASIKGKFVAFTKKKVKPKRIFTKSSRATLDLRRMVERETPVKQHGFKEGDITHTNVLNQ